MQQRSFLFLQGDAGPFFNRLGVALRERGHRVERINVCGGDWLYWRKLRAWNYRAPARDFGGFVAERIQRCATSDLLVAGDCRPLHAMAIKVARHAGVRVQVFEEGYLRPHWFTLERNGVNGYSELPRDPRWYREHPLASREPQSPLPAAGDLRYQAGYDLSFHIANLLLRPCYPRYRSHRPRPAHLEYAAWIARFAALPVNARHAERLLGRLVASDTPFFVLPLQLESDSQIQFHSPFRSLRETLRFVTESFARYAPADTHLLIKRHPLDTGLVRYSPLLRERRRALDLSDRLHYIDGGDLGALLAHARGVVTVNSTVGMSALAAGCPVACTGRAIYDLLGLTFQGPLDAFWRAPEPADPGLLQAFRNVVIHTTQVNGNFWTPRGIRLGVAGSIVRLESEDPPPGKHPMAPLERPRSASAGAVTMTPQHIHQQCVQSERDQ